MEIWYTLTGDVDKRPVQDAIVAINEELYNKPVRKMKMLIASGGGDVDSGVNLYAYLKALPIDVETIAFGKLDIAAIPIFLGGKRRPRDAACQFLFHEGRYTMSDPTAQLHAHEEAVAVFRSNLHNTIYILARETGNDTEVVANMLRRSKIMNETEALDFGLCHEIIDELPLQQQQEKGFGFLQKRASSESHPKQPRQVQPLHAESEDDRA
jgi:ATP-dependent protease ClpP protease subunit